MSSKELLEVLRLLAKLSAEEKNTLVKYLCVLQDSEGRSLQPAFEPVTRIE